MSQAGTAPPRAVVVMGLSFPNPVGLAAGFDKHGDFVRVAERVGFGHIEVGTVTPRPEPGHNLGVAVLAGKLGWRRGTASRGGGIICGVSIGQNLDTPRGEAVEDYVSCLASVWDIADYVTVNLSAPGARYLHEPPCEGLLRALLARLKEEQATLAARSGRYVPLAAKVGLDPSATELPEIVRHVRDHRFDAIIAALGPGDRGAEPGPVADALIREHGPASVRLLTSALAGATSVISAGGVLSGEITRERLCAGASLVQLYRGLVNEGPGLIQKILVCLAGSPCPGRPGLDLSPSTHRQV